MVTEPVIPLSTFLDEEDGRNANLITWGLHQVTVSVTIIFVFFLKENKLEIIKNPL